jgi:putative membrane protein
MDRGSPPFAIEPNVSNHLAWVNTILGLQRTLMAAERTAVTLIAFGFTVAQAFRNIEAGIPRWLLMFGRHVPRDVGLLMIAAGVGSLTLFTWQYLRAVDYLEADAFERISLPIDTPLHQLTCFTAYAILLLGLVAFASIFVSF